MNTTNGKGKRESGAVAVIVALSLAVLLGFVGLVIDLGHLYVNKTELQNATDACALAAANELVCDTSLGACPVAFLQNAEAAGIFVASRNNKDFQGSSVSIAASDVKFYTALAPNVSYLSQAAGADPKSKFAMCTVRVTGIVPWFMGVLGVGQQSVSAQAVATLAPGQTACNAAPVGICAKDISAAPNFGFNTLGEWITSAFNNGGGNQDDSGLDGNFRWIDFTPNAGGTNEIREQLLGNGGVCGIRVGDDVKEQGVKQGSKSAWNTRFGMYSNGASAPTPSDTPPDKTGYAYPSKAPGPDIPVGTSAYSDYRSRQGSNIPFKSNEYAPTGAAGNIPGNPISSAEHLQYGAERRLVAAPIIQCNQTSNVKILGMACVLMLNPMSNGATGELYLEWRGLANAPASPCRSAGVAGGTSGPLVPTLVQ